MRPLEPAVTALFAKSNSSFTTQKPGLRLAPVNLFPLISVVHLIANPNAFLAALLF